MTANEADRVPSSGTHVPVRRYAERDIFQLDKAGNYYFRHVLALTAEGLHAKSDIAAELAYRDQQIDALTAESDSLRDQLQASQCAEAMLTDEVRGLKERRDSLAKELVETQKELRSVARAGNDQFIQLEALAKERDSLRADAGRYRWLKTRINWEDTVRRYGELSTCHREWTHIDMRHKSERPLSEHIDEYIDAAMKPPLPDTKETE